jgi:hypothetical protein
MGNELETAFEAFLDRIDFPKIYPEIRATIMCRLWGIRATPPAELLSTLLRDEVARIPSVEDREQFENFFELLCKSLLVHQTSGNPFHLVVLPPPHRLHDIQNRVYIRNLEIQALCPLLNEDHVPAEYVAEFQALVERVGQETEILSRVIRETVTPSVTVSLTAWTEYLDAIDRGVENAFNKLGWLCMKIQRETRSPG